ncbi:MAG: murein L,D-transpeptidase catalytic domain family protein [Ferruginibacter sp.]
MKKSGLRNFTVLILALILTLVTLPFAFSKSGNIINVTSSTLILPSINLAKKGVTENNLLLNLYTTLNLSEKGLTQEAFENAIKGYAYLKSSGKLKNEHVISIVDFTLSSTKKRLFIIDLDKQEILFNTYVAHGQKTGEEFAKSFSNNPESYQSSPGFYITSDTYCGKNGYSMHLLGQENGFNDKANERAIVMHGAHYVSESFIKTRGFLGRSWGCPAVPENLNKPIIETIKNGTCLFIFTPDNKYLSESKILNS